MVGVCLRWSLWLVLGPWESPRADDRARPLSSQRVWSEWEGERGHGAKVLAGLGTRRALREMGSSRGPGGRSPLHTSSGASRDRRPPPAALWVGLGHRLSSTHLSRVSSLLRGADTGHPGQQAWGPKCGPEPPLRFLRAPPTFPPWFCPPALTKGPSFGPSGLASTTSGLLACAGCRARHDQQSSGLQV